MSNWRLPGTNTGLFWRQEIKPGFERYTQRRTFLFGFFFRWVFIGITIWRKEEA